MYFDNQIHRSMLTTVEISRSNLEIERHLEVNEAEFNPNSRQLEKESHERNYRNIPTEFYGMNDVTVSSYDDGNIITINVGVEKGGTNCDPHKTKTNLRSLSTVPTSLSWSGEIRKSSNIFLNNISSSRSTMTGTLSNHCTISRSAIHDKKNINAKHNQCYKRRALKCYRNFKANVNKTETSEIFPGHSSFNICTNFQIVISILFFCGRQLTRHKTWSNLLMKIFFILFVAFPVSPARGFENMEIINPKQYCQRAPHLTPQQRVLCRLDTKMFKYIEEGVLLSSKQCSKEFKHERWNCTRSPPSFFKSLVNQDTKESAFVHALASAAVSHAVTTGCTKGDLLECGCDDTQIRSYDLLRQEAARRKLVVNETLLRRAASEFKWNGCGDNIDYGYKMSRHFFNNNQQGDIKTIVVQHNYEAGRLAIKNHMERTCKCHGLTGTCTIHTCWQKMPKFIETSSRLHWRYNAALPVKMNNDMSSLTVSRSLRRRARKRLSTRRGKRDAPLAPKADFEEAKTRTKRRKRGETYSIKTRRRLRKHMLSAEDLVYSEPSLSFCNRVKKGGSLGTARRVCNPNITGAGSCDRLCCGRGHVATTVLKTKPCRCKFKYCCEVICDECTVESIIYTCR